MLCALCAQSACFDPGQVLPGPGPVGGPDDGVVIDGDDGAQNKQVPTNGLRLDQAPLAALQTSALDAAWTDVLTGDPAGDELLRYVASCALGPDQQLAGHPGYYGLAPQWYDGDCDGTCQRWVSACLLAHANALGDSVAIRIRGPHPNLSATDPAFTYQEAGYYGNVFGGLGQSFACIGGGMLEDLGTGANADHYLEGRICGVGACGLTSTGFCGAMTGGVLALPDSGAACVTDAGTDGAYADCHTGLSAEPRPRLSPTVHEVITVYLEP